MTHWLTPAYIGPGAGFAFLGSFLSLVLAVLAGIASAIIWPFRMAWSLLKRPRRTAVKKAIFLGFDGLDPVGEHLGQLGVDDEIGGKVLL